MFIEEDVSPDPLRIDVSSLHMVHFLSDAFSHRFLLSINAMSNSTTFGMVTLYVQQSTFQPARKLSRLRRRRWRGYLVRLALLTGKTANLRSVNRGGGRRAVLCLVLCV